MNQLGIFAKYWQPGAVKSRLAASIGEVPASEIYRAFVVALLRRMRNVADRQVVMYTPHACQEAFASIACNDWELQPQTEGDLGARMHHYFETAFAGGAERVVLIGSDSPTLPVDYLQEAFTLLETQRVVLGPTADGGYYLVGASHEVPPIFENIAWSTPDVWQQTLDLLDRASLPFEILSPWYDVDNDGDLRRLREELMTLDVEDPVWQRLLRAVEIAF